MKHSIVIASTISLTLFMSCFSGEKVVKTVVKEIFDVSKDIVLTATPEGKIASVYWKDKTLMAQGPVSGGKKNGLWKVYAKGSNGKTVMAEVNFKDDLVDGETKEFYPSGRLQCVTHRKNGVLEGSRMTYYENGIGMVEEYYKNGKKNGKSFEYYPNGMTKENAYFKDGIRDGISNTFYKNGKRQAMGRYAMGKKNGLWEYYNEETGMPESRGNYADDEKTGTWTIFDTAGRKADEKKY